MFAMSDHNFSAVLIASIVIKSLSWLRRSKAFNCFAGNVLTLFMFFDDCITSDYDCSVTISVGVSILRLDSTLCISLVFALSTCILSTTTILLSLTF